MKAVVACLVLLAVSCVFGANCPSFNYKCASKDGACSTKSDSATNVFSVVTCSNHQACNVTTFNSASDFSGTCYSPATAGQACNPGCATGLYCSSSVCTAITYGVAVGQSCTAGQKYCANDLSCVAGTCTATSTEGQDCGVAGCNLGLTCNYLGKCITKYSVAAGGNCTGSLEDCDAGLICNSGVCKTPASTSSNADCSVTNPCTNSLEECDLTCSAGVTTGKCHAKPADVSSCAKKNDQAVDSCKKSNKICVDDYTSCKDNCKSKLCATCKGEDDVDDQPTCGNNYCSGAVSVAASVVLLGAALFIAM